MKIFVASALALLLPVMAHSAILPERTKYDNRIRYVEYNHDDVVVVKTMVGLTTLIQLEKGESLEASEAGIGIGDVEAWTLAVRENNIFIKPIDEFPETNINLVTNKRSYSFDLVEAKSKTDVSFVVRFNYPVIEVPKAAPVEVAAPCSDGKRNFIYYKYGDDEIAPTKVWDDGKFTCFQYPNNKPLPAIYKHMPGTELDETLVNFNIIDDIIVVQTTANEFRLRFADKVMGIKTDNLNGIPFNKNRTATGQKREVIKNEQE